MGCPWTVGHLYQGQISSLLSRVYRPRMQLKLFLLWACVFVCVCRDWYSYSTASLKGRGPTVIVCTLCFLTNIMNTWTSPGETTRQKQSSPIIELTTYCCVVWQKQLSTVSWHRAMHARTHTHTHTHPHTHTHTHTHTQASSLTLN